MKSKCDKCGSEEEEFYFITQDEGLLCVWCRFGINKPSSIPEFDEPV